MAALIFAAFLCLYVGTMAPALAPYRDTGEMASAAATLSVAHPTSYPSYVMLGHLAQKLPLGNAAYRLNLLSAAAAALACAAVFLLARRRWGAAAGAAAALLLGLDGTFRSIAQVQEMYSLWVLGGVGVLALALRLRDRYSTRLWRGFCFVYGLALTNRLDVLLWAPGLLWLALTDSEQAPEIPWAFCAFAVAPAAQALLGSNWPIVALAAATALWRRPRGAGLSWVAASGLCAAAGLSVYLFLPVRSATGPWLDWNHPALPANFAESLLRSRYGGTLDLLSKNYATGELFGANMLLYARHLWDAFSLPGLLLIAHGCATAFRADRRRWLGQAACWWWCGPVFLFLANLPPNPHAAAIVEPHYLLSDVILIVWAAEGAGALAAARAWLAPAAALAVAAAGLLPAKLARYQRREHLYSYDFAKTVLRHAPEGAVVVAKKDVQLYALWSYQTLQGWRPDVRVVAQGLAGSPWYVASWKRRDPALGAALGPLSDEQAWRRLGPVFATPDAEPPPSAKPRGVLSSLEPAEPVEPRLMELDVRRGRYDYETAQDFFTSDLVDSRAQPLYRLGAALGLAGRKDEARAALLEAWALHYDMAEPSMYLGYLAYAGGDLAGARALYALSSELYDRLLARAAEYRALPAVTQGIRRGAAESFMHRGVVAEKLGDREQARLFYEESLRRAPLAQTHYDLAVLFWGRDWARAESELVEALKLEPGHAEARRYLAQLRATSAGRRR